MALFLLIETDGGDMEISEILNWVFGGGIVATLIAVVTLKSTVQKAKAEAERAKADAETVRIDNAEHATRILIDNIVEPLRKELNATRREMARLRKALDSASTCEFHSTCPVLGELRITNEDGRRTEKSNEG